MNEFTEPMTISPTARKLAERYGVSPEVMEEIISDTRSRTKIPRSAGPAVVNAPQTIHTVHEQPVAVLLTPPIVAASVAPPIAPSVAEPVAPVVIAPPIVTQPVVVPPTIVRPDDHRNDNALSAVTVILIILLILALIGLFYLWQTQHAQAPSRPVADTAQVIQPRDTTPMTLAIDTAKLPPPIANVQTVKPARHRARSRRAATSKSFFTSSGLAAQEHLADLRAQGNHKAYLETVNRGGNTFYRLHDGSTAKKRSRRRRP